MGCRLLLLPGGPSTANVRLATTSKLANVLFTYELSRRLHGTSVTANALHPGVVRTSFGAEDPGTAQRLFTPVMRPFMKTPARGAATTIHLASVPDIESVTGRYFANSKPKRSSKRSYDDATAARLWQASAELVSPGGCCDGSIPMCFDDGELIVGDADVLLGHIGGCPFYIDGRQ